MVERRATQADVAQRAGVSRTAASFVLSGRKDIQLSDQVRRRVLKAAEELGYTPNLTARSLRTRVTSTISLISDTIATAPFAGEMIRGASEAALAQDHLLFVADTESDNRTEERLVQGMLDRQVDGFVYASMFTRPVSLPVGLAGRPVVFLNCFPASGGALTVLPDEAEAGRLAARILLDAGYREGIHVIGGRHTTEGNPHGVYAGRERMQGIEEALSEAAVRIAGTVDCPWEPEEGYRAASAMLRTRPLPQAVICCNDRLALGVYQAVQEAGLMIPDDLSVVSFDDSDLASWLRPPLTSIALPHDEMGRAAVDLLLAGDLASATHRIPMPASLRRSVAVARPRRALPGRGAF